MADSTQPTVPSPPQTISLVGCSGMSRHISRALSGGVSSKSTTCEKTSHLSNRLFVGIDSYSMRRGVSKS